MLYLQTDRRTNETKIRRYLMSLKVFFAKNLTTSDLSTDLDLKPHYYANDYQTIKKKVLEVAEFLKYQVRAINDEYQEIFIERPGSSDIIITMFRAGSSGYRVDLKVNIQSGISFGGAKKLVVNFYHILDPRLTRKGN